VIDLVSVADLFTVLNALMGFSAVVVALEGELELAYLLIVACVLADGLDGIVARRFGSRWSIGDYLDIMADTASFAFAPSVIMYLTFREGLGSPDLGLGLVGGRLLILIAAGLVITTGLMRLARFCLESNGDGSDRYFNGMPIPATALLIAAMLLMGLPGVVVFIFTFGSAALMVSDLRYPKPRGSPGLVVGVLGFLLIATTLIAGPLEWFSEYLMYLTFTGVLMYQYVGGFTEALKERFIDEEPEPDDGSARGPQAGGRKGK
jgi:CDP-diacylglycerol--serine O-phosphatidyltransferase